MVLPAAQYYVEPGNWTSYVKNTIGNGPDYKDKYNFTIGVDGGGIVNPAEGCNKLFTSKYKCGDGDEKTLMINKDAGGKTAVFNCQTESTRCNNLRMYIKDNGVLTVNDITNSKNPKIVWENTDPMYGIAMEDYRAVKGKKFGAEKEGRNYLNAGEYLELGEFIGSPTGTCRLEMVEDDTTGKISLKVLYNVEGCSSKNDDSQINKDSISLYTIPLVDNSLVGKIAYINEKGKLNEYPDSMTGYTPKYEKIGNYNTSGTSDLGVFSTNSYNECQTKCSELNNDGTDETKDKEKCAGIIYNGASTTDNCKLKGKDVYQEQRILDNNYEYYVRNKTINNDISCPSTVEFSNSNEYSHLMKHMGSIMTPSTTCSLAKHTEAERNALKEKREELKSKANEMKSKIKNLNISDTKLTKRLLANANKLKDQKIELNELRTGNTDLTGNQYKQLEALEEDRDLNMVAKNYKHIMWSILAILIMIGAIKVTKMFSSSGSSISDSISNTLSDVSSNISSSTS